MPSSVLVGEIPYSTLFPSRPLFRLNHLFLGVLVLFVMFALKCLNWILSVSSVFLGYSRLQKGYKCYSPTLGRYLISADVTFLRPLHSFLNLMFMVVRGRKIIF
ncbi:hypothetical protein ACH5RR_001235 [Cinchona calisaya]|uniref:Retroviral polymerase SH3-like domain-containing protein n=1 Tax=Cinchona calisaya TaxID=153742 RepID=A0ABD3B2X9_9GENT